MTLTASCHCGAVHIEVDTAPVDLNECHCSVCRRYAVRWGYYPRDAIRFRAAPDASVAYAWGEKNIEFRRCRTCGCVTHWQAVDPTYQRIGLNFRLFDPADTADIPIRITEGPPSEAGA